jgi:hypothetical protein
MSKSQLTIVLALVLLFASFNAFCADDWTLQSPGTKPSARRSHEMCYIGGDQVLLFGGYDGDVGVRDDETWLYDLSDDTWTLQSPGTGPSAREAHAMCYIGGDQVLLFGGTDGSSYYDDTWVYDLSADTWTQQSPGTGPSQRSGHAMCYIGGDQVLLFGGWNGSSNYDDTWVYDLSADTWTQQSPGTKPLPRRIHTMCYIDVNQFLLFGGTDGSYKDDTWLYDLSGDTWTQQNPVTKPSVRSDHAMCYIGGKQALLFGGYGGSNNDDTWVYDLSDNTWTLDGNTTQPSARSSHRMAMTSLDGSSNIVLFGGWNNPSYYDDTWTFGGGDYALPVELSSFHAEVVKGGIKLHWSTASEINNKGFIVYKQSQQGSLLPCSELIEGAGTTSEPQQYSFTDKDVQPDVLYTYQIADIEEGTGKETLHPAITIIASKDALQAKEIPEAFALHANYPNPFNPTTTIEFDVPVGTYNYTSLRIYDASGKLVKTLIDEPMDGGKYSVSWHGKDDSGNAVSSGTYYCKMITETYSETRQLVLLK